MIHHTTDVEASSGTVINKDYNATANYFGSPYDIFINRDGTIDLTPRWIYATTKFQYLKNIPPIRILSHTKHFYAGVGETEDMRKDYVHIGVSGDFDSQAPPKIQLYSLSEVIKILVKGLQINPRTHLFYHGDQVVTSCPGFRFVSKSYLIGLTKDAFVAPLYTAPMQILSFTVQPTNIEIDAIISPAIEVSLLGVGNAVVTSFTGAVTISIDNMPGEFATLAGTLTVRAVRGVATFDDISINVAGENYTLRASASGKVDAISTPFDIEVFSMLFYSDMSIYDNEEVPTRWSNWTVPTIQAYTWNPIGGSGSVGYSAGGATGIAENRKVILSSDVLSTHDFYSWDTADDDTPIQFIDADVITRLRIHTQQSIAMALVTRATGSFGTNLTGYGAVIVPQISGSFNLIKYVDGSGSILATTFMSIGRYGWYNIRLQALDDNIKAKFWDFDNEEPDSWTLEVVDSPSLQNNQIGIYVRGEYKIPIDVISLSAEGGNPPASIPRQFDYVADLRNEPTGSITGAGEWEIMASVPEISASVFNAYDYPNNDSSGIDEALQGRVVVFYCPGSAYTAGTYSSIVKFKPAGDDIVDGEVLMRCSQGGPTGAVGISNGVILRGSGSSGYVVHFSATDFLEIGKLEGGVYTDLGLVDMGTIGGKNRYIRARVEGNTIYAKAWRDTITSEQTPNNYTEPLTWDMTVEDTSIISSGYFGYKTTRMPYAGLINPHSLDFMGVKIVETLHWESSSYDLGVSYGTDALDVNNILKFVNQTYQPSINGEFSIPSGSNLFEVQAPTTKTLLYSPSGSINNIDIRILANASGSLAAIVRGNVASVDYDTIVNAFRFSILQPAIHVAADHVTGRSDGDAIEVWEDLSGNNNDCDGTTLLDPDYTTGIVNGLPVIRFFDNINSTMRINDKVIGNSVSAQMTILAVCKYNDTTPACAVISTRHDNISGWTFRYNSATEISYFHAPSATYTPTLTLAVSDQFNILVIRRDGLDVEIGVNNTLNSPVAISGYAENTDEAYTCIGYEGPNWSILDGDIAELLIYESVVSEEDLDDIVNYLLNKYNITP